MRRLLACAAALLIGGIASTPSAKVIGAEGSASSLQMLIDRTPEGGTLNLPSGTYEGPAVVDKRLTMRMPPDARLVNRSGQPALTVRANGVVLEGLNVSDDQQDPKLPAVLIESNGNRISGLTLDTQAGGVFLRTADDNVIENSRIIGRPPADGNEAYSLRGNGIDLLQSSRNRIEGNEIDHVHDGIYVESSNETTVVNNRVEHSRYGYHFMFSGKPRLIDNQGSLNVTGGMVMGVEGAIVRGNRFSKQSENVNSQGILLFDVHRSEISDNRVEGNRIGFYVENSTDNRLTGNVISRNFIGLQMLKSEGNVFANSSFVSNVIQAQSTDSKDNRLDGNYWDDLQGVDRDGDGHSDLPYEVDPFFLKLTEEIWPFQAFFQSPGLPFLEKLFRTDTANWLKDASPLMRPPESDSQSPAGGGAVPYIGAAMLAASLFSLYKWGIRKS